MSQKIERSVYQRLAAVSGVTNIVGTNIFYINADEGTAFPYITLLRITTDAMAVSSGTNSSGSTNVTDQIDMFGATYESVKLLADAVRSALFGWNSTGSDPSISSVILISERDEFERPASGKAVPIYRVTQDYSIWFAG
jgi:hypothetical protein